MRSSNQLHADRALGRCIVVAVAALFGSMAPARAQGMVPRVVRLEAGSVNHGDLLRAQPALGITVGWLKGSSGAVQLRVLRQSQKEASTTVGRDSRTWLVTEWEHAFGVPAQYHRQVLVRLGGGVMFRPVLSPAPALGAGLELRYPLASHWAILASIEDDAALLFTQDATFCDAFRGCATYHFDGQLEHNLGLILSGEWSR